MALNFGKSKSDWWDSDIGDYQRMKEQHFHQEKMRMIVEMQHHQAMQAQQHAMYHPHLGQAAMGNPQAIGMIGCDPAQEREEKPKKKRPNKLLVLLESGCGV